MEMVAPMLRSGRMPNGLLEGLLRRLSVSAAAGIDPVRSWTAETARLPRRWRPVMEEVGRGLAAGDGLAASMDRCPGAFPATVRAAVAVGERTGRDAESLRDAADVIERSMSLRRRLRAGLVRPVLQLLAAVVVVGLLILVGGAITDLDGRPVDLVGLGLSGRAGLATFVVVVACGCILTTAAMALAARSWADHGIVRMIGTRVPVVGPAAVSAEAAAWCRAASAAAHAGLDAGRLATLAGAAAPGLRIDPQALESSLRAGATLDEALRATRRLPVPVVEAVAVGELTGTTAEALGRLAERLEDQATRGFAAAASATGFAAWGGVALLVAVIIFRVASFYGGLLNAAAAGIR